METMNNNPFFTPLPEESLDPKDVVSIKQLDIDKLLAMKARHMEKLTHNFDESYARIVMSKAKNPQEQRKLLDALKKAFDSIHYVPTGWGEEYCYNVPVPPYLDEKGWDYLLTIYGNIMFEEEAENPQPAEVTPQQAPTLSEMLTEEGLLNKWIASSTHNLEVALNGSKKNTEDMINQIKALRDGSLTRMQDKLSEAENQMDAMRLEIDTLRQWRGEWEKWRQMVLDSYDPSDIAEAGGVNDLDLMREAIETVLDERQREQKLQEENEKLRQSQEKWRESKEYLDEKEKWEKLGKKSIKVQEIKEKLLAYADTFTATEGERLRSFVLNINELLRETAWIGETGGIVGEVMTKFNKKHNQPTIAGDYVMHKHVQQEVANVESGATGFNMK